jgi:hypothetical protein
VWICKGPRGCSTISATYVAKAAAKAAAGAGTVEVEDSAAVTAAEEGKEERGSVQPRLCPRCNPPPQPRSRFNRRVNQWWFSPPGSR